VERDFRIRDYEHLELRLIILLTFVKLLGRIMDQAELLEQWRSELTALQTHSDLPPQAREDLEDELHTCLKSLAGHSVGKRSGERRQPQPWRAFIGDGYVVTDSNSMIRKSNDSFRLLLNISYGCDGIPLLVFIAKVDRPRFIQEFFRVRRDDSYMSDLNIRLQPIAQPPIQASLMGQAVHDSYNKRLSVVWALHS